MKQSNSLLHGSGEYIRIGARAIEVIQFLNGAQDYEALLFFCEIDRVNELVLFLAAKLRRDRE